MRNRVTIGILLLLLVMIGQIACQSSPEAVFLSELTLTPTVWIEATAVSPELTAQSVIPTVPTETPTAVPTLLPSTPTALPAATAIIPTQFENFKLNLNEMTQYELLETIPNIEQNIVREIFQNQPYVTIEQFRHEIGQSVDSLQLRTFEQYVYVPIDRNESDLATLMQMPGVDEIIGSALIGERPYASNLAFLTKLAQFLTAEQLAVAGGYLSD